MKISKVIASLLGILLVAAAIWFFAFRKKEKPLVLETERPQLGHISKSVTATGTIQPVDTVSVGTQVSGTIKIINADFNSKVRKGQLLAELDKALFQAQVDQFRANLAVAQSQLAYQQDFYNREKLMYDSQVIARQEYETAAFQLNSAKATVLSVRAQLQSAEKNLSYCEIYSPIDGVVLTRNVSIGQTVAASFNTPTLFIIAKDISKMQVQAAVDEADIGNVTRGQRVTFTVDAFPDDIFSGIVQEIRLQPTVSANVVTYTTIINAANNNMRLKPGMTANIIVYTHEENNALLISSKAIKFKPDSSLNTQFRIVSLSMDTSTTGSNSRLENDNVAINTKIAKKDTASGRHLAFVWLKRGDSLIQKKIRTGLNDDAHVQVVDGLSPDNEVVTGLIQQASGTASAKGSTQQRSPFLPQRPGQRSTPTKR
ncbi:MAG: efflux RND transporter periplasmic adaptor subunit [Bacteroidetes bacterium]|nr:MAG: efflux RND transporter periplasmic adaptor subunit [Bacteroidota bacterium]